jgi:hypothetical protein
LQTKTRRGPQFEQLLPQELRKGWLLQAQWQTALQPLRVLLQMGSLEAWLRQIRLLLRPAKLKPGTTGTFKR